MIILRYIGIDDGEPPKKSVVLADGAHSPESFISLTINDCDKIFQTMDMDRRSDNIKAKVYGSIADALNKNGHNVMLTVGQIPLEFILNAIDPAAQIAAIYPTVPFEDWLIHSAGLLKTTGMKAINEDDLRSILDSYMPDTMQLQQSTRVKWHIKINSTLKIETDGQYDLISDYFRDRIYLEDQKRLINMAIPCTSTKEIINPNIPSPSTTGEICTTPKSIVSLYNTTPIRDVDPFMKDNLDTIGKYIDEHK